jgi:hypothetical protein
VSRRDRKKTDFRPLAPLGSIRRCTSGLAANYHSGFGGPALDDFCQSASGISQMLDKSEQNA